MLIGSHAAFDKRIFVFPGVTQTAYQIIVNETDSADQKWDSGKVASNSTTLAVL